MKLKRTHACGEIPTSLVGKKVVLSGWVDRYRDHGGVVFIDLRDRTGICQVVFDPALTSVDEASTLRLEAVISVEGEVRKRPAGMENAQLASGQIEIAVKNLEILNRAQALPFSLREDSPSAGEVEETLRFKYRYLDLRTKQLQNGLRLRHEFLRRAREFYYEQGFWEIETPILYKSTPEGARDYLVPSRVHPGKFYALPQSPQTLKQLCMIGGLDRYVQIARCFRDEDLRADRQPEFTQIDVEMSFIDEIDIQNLHEKLMQKVFKDVLNEEVKIPFERIAYKDAIRFYGSDKPDLRIPLKLFDLSAQGKKTEFQVYVKTLEQGGVLAALCLPENEPMSRSELDALPKKVAAYGAKGLGWIRIKAPGDWQSPQAKFFPEALKKEVEALLPFKPPCILLLVCDKEDIAYPSLGSLRVEYGNKLFPRKNKEYKFAWVTDFPLFEYDAKEKRLNAAHHPFTSPAPEDQERFLKATKIEDLVSVKARAYDLVLNGYEIGGGSIRIYNPEVQAAMFKHLGMTQEQAQNKFGFFLEALSYGTPPHGGIAFGVDRVAMILSDTDAIRDVIAFPKTQKATCLMSDAPSLVDAHQLEELHLQIKLPPT